MTVLRQYENFLKTEQKSPLTMKSYLSDLKQFSRWLESGAKKENSRILEVSKLDAAQYKAYMINDLARKPSGINRALSSLTAFYDWAVREGKISANPWTGLHQARAVHDSPRALTPEELERLARVVAECGDKREAGLFHVLLNVGLKIGEVEALRMADVEIGPEKGLLTVRSERGLRYRQVPLNRAARQALLEYMQVRPENNEFLFVSQKGGGLTANAIWKLIKAFGEKAGIPELSPQMLRHTFGKRLIVEYEMDLPTAAALMGNESIQTISKYATADRDRMKNAFEKLSKA